MLDPVPAIRRATEQASAPPRLIDKPGVRFNLPRRSSPYILSARGAHTDCAVARTGPRQEGVRVLDKRCGACSGQMNGYATVCPWCGRRVVVTNLMRGSLVAVLLLGFFVLAHSVQLKDVKRIVGLGADEPITLADVAARASEPAWIRWLVGVFSADRDDPAGRTLAILDVHRRMPAEPRDTGALSQLCALPDTGLALRLVQEYPMLSDLDIRSAVCGVIPRGFTAAQVRAVLGAPRIIVRAAPRQEEWLYPTRQLRLMDGRVATVER